MDNCLRLPHSLVEAKDEHETKSSLHHEEQMCGTASNPTGEELISYCDRPLERFCSSQFNPGCGASSSPILAKTTALRRKYGRGLRKGSIPNTGAHATEFFAERTGRGAHLSTALLPAILVTALLLIDGAASQLRSPILTNFKCEANGCCDQHEWCRFWASIGECAANSDWMSSNCQLACNTCRPTVIPAQQPVTTPPTGVVGSFPLNTPQPTPNAATTPRTTATAGRGGGICRTDSTAEQLAADGLINPIEEFGSRFLLSVDDVTRAVGGGCVPELTPGDCSQSLCYHAAYRSFDGLCNNLQQPLKGAAFRQYIRLLPPEYDNGFSEPVSSVSQTRPTVREASRILLASAQVVTHDSFNSLMMQWGQFISHDMAKTTLQPTSNCASCSPIPSKCVPVGISDKDTNSAFVQRGCLKISRSAPVCGTGTTPSTPRQQLNENTAFIDGSQIYGSSSKDLHKFRDGRTAFLKMDRFNQLLVLPFDHSKCGSGPASCTASFTAGDIRANLFLGLSSMHILFAREHNRVAEALQRINPSWSGDRIFQEARKIVGAEIQLITYRDFLPKVLGSSFNQVIGAYNDYDPRVDPSISNVFTTSAYRFGHGMILESYPRIGANGQSIPEGPFMFGDGIFKSSKILFEGGIDPVLRGFWNTAVKRPHRMTPAITERMFGSTDLGSLNIMRGREHGTAPYNKWRLFCGMASAPTFEALSGQILDASVRSTLQEVYKSPDDMDLYVGAMVEDPVAGGLVGATLSCIVGDQFKRSRDGDRFYFEHRGVFTAAQLAEVRKASLARVLCDNGDRITEVPADAFLLPRGNLAQCSTLPQIDLSRWKE